MTLPPELVAEIDALEHACDGAAPDRTPCPHPAAWVIYYLGPFCARGCVHTSMVCARHRELGRLGAVEYRFADRAFIARPVAESRI